MELVTRAKARARGLRRYFTGRPCKHGHTAERFVDECQCVVCADDCQTNWSRSERGLASARKTMLRQRVDYPERAMLISARGRAKKQGVPFEISAQDVMAAWPPDGRCPIFGEVMTSGAGKGRIGPYSATLDRIEPSRGYVRGNIAVISYRANRIKNDVEDPEIFRRVAAYMERRLST